MDNPISMSNTPVGNPGESIWQPAAEGRRGTLDDRRVSEAPPQARTRSMRPTGEADGIAGPAGTRRSLDLRRATVETPSSGGAVEGAGPGHSGGADRPPPPAEKPPDFLATYRKIRRLEGRYRDRPDEAPAETLRRAVANLSKYVMTRYRTVIGPSTQLGSFEGGIPKATRAYAALREKAGQAEEGGDFEQAASIRTDLLEIDLHAARALQALSNLVEQTASSSTREATAPTLDWSLTQRQLAGIRNHLFRLRQFGDAKYFENCLHRIEVRIRQVFNRHLKNELPRPLRSKYPPRSVQMYRLLEDMARPTEAAGGAAPPGGVREGFVELNDFVDRNLRSLTRKYGPLETLAAAAGVPAQQTPVQVQPPGTAGIVAVGAELPLQPASPAPEPGCVPIASRTPAGDGAGQPLPGMTTPTPTSAVSAAPMLVPPWVEDDFAVERALIAGELPPGFDASALIHEAGTFEQFGLGAALAGGRLPMQTIDALLEGYEATDGGGANALFIDYLRSLKENIERALNHAYPGRADRQWLDRVRLLQRCREGLTAPERPGGEAVAVPPVADPFSESPGPSSRFMPARAAGTAVAPARERLPAQRQAIVERFRSGDALAEARANLVYGGAEALGLSEEATRGLLEDLEALHRFDGQNPEALADLDWTGIRALVAVLDFVPPSL